MELYYIIQAVFFNLAAQRKWQRRLRLSAGAEQTAVFLQNFTDQEYFMGRGKVFQPGGANFEQHYLEVTPEMLAALFPGKVVPA